MKETNHDYQNCLVGNYYDRDCTGEFSSWESFKSAFAGFCSDGFDDTYHYVFRYDINKQDDGKYTLELCIMLQRKGIYLHLYIYNIDNYILNTEVKKWLMERYEYIKGLWKEVSK